MSERLDLAHAAAAADPADAPGTPPPDHAVPTTVPQTRLHPIYLVIETARTARSAIPIVVVTVLGGAPWWVNAGLFAFVMIIAVAQWYRRRYWVAGDVFHLESGVLARVSRSIPVARITSLTAVRSLAQRLLRVWGLKIQSPGHDRSATISLPSLSNRRLAELSSALASTPARPSESAGPPGADLAVLRFRELLLAAITAATIPLTFAALTVTWLRFSELLPARTQEFMEQTVVPGGPGAVIAALVIAAIVLGLTGSVLRSYAFTVRREGHLLYLTRGLLGRRGVTVDARRVHAVRIVENLWRTMFGYCSLQLEVAGLGTVNTAQRTLFPLIRTSRARALVLGALPELRWHPEPMRRIPRELRRRYLTVPMSYGAGLAALLLLLPGWWRLLAVLPIPLAIALGVARAREVRWYSDEFVVTLRWRRAIVRNTVVARRDGCQSVEWSSSPWQERAGVAGFRMKFSSGRSAHIAYLPVDEASQLLRNVGRPQP